MPEVNETKYFSTFSDGNEDYVVKDAEARSNLSTHESTIIATSTGSHGIRYIEGVLSYKDSNSEWQEIKTGGGVVISYEDYVALSNEEKNNGLMYFCPDAPSTVVDGSAHTIQNGSGTDMAMRTNLKFVGLNVTDDSVNDATVISATETDLSGYYTKTESDNRYYTKTASDERFERVHTWVSYTMLASDWDTNTKQYSFESVYPATNYDIVDLMLNMSSITEAQVTAWEDAECGGGYYDSNILVAQGTVPTVDIPLKLCIKSKV